jgi:FKBP-type peptidyl-prolyl cis-trans isomerase FklB
MDKVSYALGLGIGRQLADMGAKELNIDDFCAGYQRHRCRQEASVRRPGSADSGAEFLSGAGEKKQQADAAEKFQSNKESGEKYLSENAKKDGVVHSAKWITISGTQRRQWQKAKGN